VQLEVTFTKVNLATVSIRARKDAGAPSSASRLFRTPVSVF